MSGCTTLYLKGDCSQVMLASCPKHAVTGHEDIGCYTKLDQGKFRLDIKKNIFTKGVVRYWNGLSREVMESPALEEFKK